MIRTKAEAEAHQRKHGFLKGGDASCPDAHANSASSTSNASPTFKPKRGAKQPNKTEASFKAYFDALRGSRLEFEPVKLRIGGNCYYTPDYGDLSALDTPIFYEVKGGHIWDDSMVKFKAAKERHQWASFEMWQKKKGEWTRLL